tara:strand:+ start:542 stop:2038 length:1497 start_codon:yes stop_codon:yes gene_type:complete
MGLLDNTTHRDYYLGNNLGSYQFTSLEDIITQFQIAYVGENKLISKIKRADISYFAQRALQELSFDTFKSIKSQQIDVPPSLTMPLPHDYVNYTKLSWVDSSGIKHPLYFTNRTNNPFQISQEDDGSYTFNERAEEVVDGDFAAGDFTSWQKNPDVIPFGAGFAKSEILSNKLVFSHRTRTNFNGAVSSPVNWGHAMAVWQELDVSDKEYVTMSASGQAVDFASGTGPGILRVGLSTSVPDGNTTNFDSTSAGDLPTTNTNLDIFDLQTDDGVASYIEWSVAVDNTTEKFLQKINVQNIDTVYVVVVSFHEFTAQDTTLTETNNVDDISVRNWTFNDYLKSPAGNEINSSTWNSYKSTTPSENNNQDYEDDLHWKMKGNRYGLDPQHAQVNGSFYIDNRLGKINFSSNISGQTVILDYISDSIGTEKEMQVHKLAEEAMYKCIAYAIISTRANVPEYIVQRFRKERFAETRKAKLRLSNIKLEEITQVLRGKSKQIKH